MKAIHILGFISILLSSATLLGQPSRVKKENPNKFAAIRSIEANQDDYIRLSGQVWELAELNFEEENSSRLLAEFLASKGFRVTKGVAGLSTAFVAEYGTGRPIVGLLGEFDALPGLSQKATSRQEALHPGAAGHGCGHNLLGVGSLAAAVAVRDLITAGKLKGTIRYYGTPAEEGGGGKVYMARAGVFDDLDVSLDWHPDAMTESITQSSQAVIDNEIIFRGVTAHAAADPWLGKSALDAAELFMHGVNLLREHVKPSVRIHYSILETNKAANVVPDFVRMSIVIRDSRLADLEELNKRIIHIAEGAALMAEVKTEVKLVNGYHEILVNRSGAAVLQHNLELLGSIQFSEQEKQFAVNIQKEMGVGMLGLHTIISNLRETENDPSHGSSDVGDVSWIVPEIGMTATTAPEGIPWHSWAVVATSGMSIGHKGMLHAASVLSMTIVDLMENPDALSKIRKEFIERKGNYTYRAMIPDGPPRR